MRIYGIVCYNILKYELMANKKCAALTKEQLKEIITTMRSGGAGFRKNEQIATALLLEANLGMRIEDILALHLQDIVMNGGRYRLNVIEKKTQKKEHLLCRSRCTASSEYTVMTETLLLIRRCFLLVNARCRNILRKWLIISDMRSLSARIHSGSILPQRYISKIIMILCLCRSSCSIAVLPLHNGTLTWIRE